MNGNDLMGIIQLTPEERDALWAGFPAIDAFDVAYPSGLQPDSSPTDPQPVAGVPTAPASSKE